MYFSGHKAAHPLNLLCFDFDSDQSACRWVRVMHRRRVKRPWPRPEQAASCDTATGKQSFPEIVVTRRKAGLAHWKQIIHAQAKDSRTGATESRTGWVAHAGDWSTNHTADTIPAPGLNGIRSGKNGLGSGLGCPLVRPTRSLKTSRPASLKPNALQQQTRNPQISAPKSWLPAKADTQNFTEPNLNPLPP